MKTCFVILLLLFAFRLMAQVQGPHDYLLLQNGEEIKARIIDTENDLLRYRKASQPNGPVYTLKKTEIFMIRYKNGTKIVYETPVETAGSMSSQSVDKQGAVIPAISGKPMLARGADNEIKMLSVPQGKSLVYVLRPYTLGFAVGMKVSCNNEYMGTTYGKQFLCIVVSAGETQIVSEAENLEVHTLMAEEGKTYYLEQKPKMGALKARCALLPLTEQVAREKMLKCKYITK